MATEAEKVAASQARQRIPTVYLTDFLELTDAGLLSLHEDQSLPSETRLYAGWELDYRIAFDVSVRLEQPAPPKGYESHRTAIMQRWRTLAEQGHEAYERLNEARILASAPRQKAGAR